jgi:hypothetical protein
MCNRIIKFSFVSSLVLLAVFLVFIPNTNAQEEKPLTQQEFVKLLYELPKNPSKKDELIEAIRTRGISFPLTDGLRSLTATKSGSDILLRRALEEAERRRANPTVYAKPSEAEGAEVLSKAREANLKAVEEMPDFIVKQLIKRSYAKGGGNWQTDDHLILAVSYSTEKGEDYKLLAVNGVPPNETTPGAGNFQNLGGTTSTGEYVTVLKDIFRAESKTTFKLADSDVLRGRRTIVYEFEVRRENSRVNIVSRGLITDETIAGFSGRIWIDRENYRVLRVETFATEIPEGFPIKAASRTVDYDWVTISDQKYLLPLSADVQLTARSYGQVQQSRNEIRFKSYQKFGTEVKVIEDDIIDEDIPPAKKDPPVKKP